MQGSQKRFEKLGLTSCYVSWSSIEYESSMKRSFYFRNLGQSSPSIWSTIWEFSMRFRAECKKKVCGCVSCQGASGRQLERCSARVAVRIRINLAGRLSRIRLNLASTQPCLFNTTSGGAIIISKMESLDPESQRKPVPTLSGARRSKTRSITSELLLLLLVLCRWRRALL